MEFCLYFLFSETDSSQSLENKLIEMSQQEYLLFLNIIQTCGAHHFQEMHLLHKFLNIVIALTSY